MKVRKNKTKLRIQTCLQRYIKVNAKARLIKNNSVLWMTLATSRNMQTQLKITKITYNVEKMKKKA